MRLPFTIILSLLWGVFLCSGCGFVQDSNVSARVTDSSVSSSMAAETFLLRPTPIPVLPPNTQIAGVEVGGLKVEIAREKLSSKLALLERPLEIKAGKTSLALRPADLKLRVPLDEMLAEARNAAAQTKSIHIPLRVEFDTEALHQQLTWLAQQVEVSPTLRVVQQNGAPQFVAQPGAWLDVAAASQQLTKYLQNPYTNRRLTLELQPHPQAAKVALAQLREQLNTIIAKWPGIAGLYFVDLKSGETITYNPNTVFSGASVMKIAILLQSYLSLPQFDAAEESFLRNMIVDSDNLAANSMLAESVKGFGTEDALDGALQMTETMQQLGLQHTYQYMPYEGFEYLVNVRNLPIKRGPPTEGSPPFTEADPVLRTTPAEMGRLLFLIEQCRQGKGELLTRFGANLTPARCQEMLDRLAQNGDQKRMVSGLPKGTRVEHKSGWVDDMQADVGIVRSPGGDFLISLFLYQDVEYLNDDVACPTFADFSRLIYSAYNPTSTNDQ